MTVKHCINIDLSGRGARKILPISKGDVNSHEVVFSLSNGNEPVDISSHFAIAAVTVRNGAEGKGVVDNAVVVGNTVVWTPSEKALSVSGNILSILTVIGSNGATLYAPSFYLWVEESFSENISEELDKALKSSDAWGIILQTAANAGAACTSAEEAKKAAQKAMISIDGTIEEGKMTLTVCDGQNNLIDTFDVDLRDLIATKLDANGAEWKEYQYPGFSKKLVLDLPDKGIRASHVSAVDVEDTYVFCGSSFVRFTTEESDESKNEEFFLPFEWVVEHPEIESKKIIATEGYVDEVGDRVTSTEKRVDKLEGMLIKYTEDDSVAYEKPVPEASAQKAILSSVGGASYKTYEVIYDDDFSFETENGGGGTDVLFSVKAGVEYEIETAGIDGVDCFLQSYETDSIVYWDGSNWFGLSLTEFKSGKCIFDVDATIYVLGVDTGEPISYNGHIKVSEMALKSAPVTEIVSVGKNLLSDKVYDINNWIAVSGKSDKVFPIDDIVEEGIYTLSGEKLADTSDVYLYLERSIDGGVTYSPAQATIDASGSPTYGHFVAASNLHSPIYFEHKSGYKWWLWLSKGSVQGAQEKLNKLSKLQIERGMLKNYALEYEPYFNKSYPMPEAITKRSTYGRGISNTYRSVVDFVNKKYTGAVEDYAFTGDEIWYINKEENGYISFYLTNAAFPRYQFNSAYGFPFMSNFSSVQKLWSGSIVLDGDFVWAASTSVGICISETRFSSYGDLTTESGKRAAFKAWIKSKYENNNPLVFAWALAEPEYIDISNDIAALLNGKDYLFVEVEGGGTVRFENEKKLAVPSKITFAEV